MFVRGGWGWTENERIRFGVHDNTKFTADQLSFS